MIQRTKFDLGGSQDGFRTVKAVVFRTAKTSFADDKTHLTLYDCMSLVAAAVAFAFRLFNAHML
ncbi:MAG: hypothetical protein H0V18_20160 [Pyrinomonadaceae bacterium]|nr:hypothetical protein [Pyrinomonadaceae bacterium]